MWVIEVVTLYFLVPAIIYYTFQSLKGEVAPFSKAIKLSLKMSIPVLITVLLSIMATIAGFVLLIVPGIILTAMYSIAIPVTIIENEGAVDSLKRSASLTDGYKWKIFGVILLMGIIIQIPIYILAFGLLGDYPSTTSCNIYVYSVVTLSIFWSGLRAVTMAFMYYDLRWIKEGVGIEEYASIFDIPLDEADVLESKYD